MSIADLMPPLMFGGLILFMLLGFPVAFSIAALGLSFGFVSVELGLFDFSYMANLPYRIYGILSNDLLLAIPFFTFMGMILERARLAEDLLEATGQLFGSLPGGLAYAVILVGAILGAITGTVAASVIAMGMMSLPVMLRYGYSNRMATGVIAASGTITQLIPPSLVLIVLADQLGRSVGDIYLGAIGPSLLQVAIFILFIAAVSILRPGTMPPLPPEARTLHGWALVWRVISGMVPALGLIFLVLGTIFMGLATPTEAGAMGAVGAMLLAALRWRLTIPLIWHAMESTMRLTAMVVFILIGSTVFSLVFYGVNGAHWLEGLLANLPGGATGFLIFVSIFVFFLAFFLDFFEIAFIVVPLLAPVAAKLGIDLIWFGVLLSITLQTAFMHPPFGFALFYVRGIAPKELPTSDIYLGAIPWLCLQLLLVAIVIFWPQSVTYWLDTGTGVDPSTIQDLDIPSPDALPPLDFGVPPDLGGPAPGGAQPPTDAAPALPGLEPPAGAPPALPGLEPPPS